VIEAARLAAQAGVRHGFFTRAGGVSEGPYASLNCGFSSGDAAARVWENRARAMRRLGVAPASLTTGRQVHGTDVIVARTPAPGKATTPADALVTDRPGITLGVLSADCAPVLIVEPAARVIGAAHAGWRGALDGVVEAVVLAATRLGARPERMVAAVGPCIAPPSYEVGPDLFARFTRIDPESEPLFARVAGSDRLLFDLKGYVLRRLAAAGVEAAEALPEDTAADGARFFSARRTRRRGEARFGLLLSAIALDG